MIKKITYLLFFLVLAAQAQDIKVYDEYSRELIKNVTCVNRTQQIKTFCKNGSFINIPNFKIGDVLLFHHKNYYTKMMLYKKNSTQIHLEPKIQNLKSIVFSVSKSPEKKKGIAEKIDVILRNEVLKSAPQTSADLLANVHGIHVQKSQLGGGSPVIRGLEANRVLLVVDGVRMNNAIYRGGHLQNSITVNPLSLERTEIIFGPSSVAYGSDALGGVVHYYTKKLNLSDQFKTHHEAYVRRSSVNNEKTVNFSSTLANTKWSSYTNINYSDFGDLKAGKNRRHGFDNWGLTPFYSDNTDKVFNDSPKKNSNPNIQKNTAYSQLDILQKVLIPINQRLDLVLNGQYSRSSDIPNFGKLNDLKSDGTLKFANWNYGPQKRLLLSSQLQFNNFNNWLRNGKLTLAYQDVSESRIQRKFGDLNKISRIENVDVFSLNGDFSVPLTKNKKRILYYGTELVYNKVNSKSKGEVLEVEDNKITGVASTFDVLSRYPNDGSSYTSAAVYTSYRQKLNDKHTLNTGLRYTHTYLKANWKLDSRLPIDEINVNNDALTASLGHIYALKGNQKIKTVLSTGFRSPNIDDLGKFREKSGKLTVPNVKLRPECLYSGEVTYKNHTKHYKVYFETNLYYTLIKNYISRQGFSGLGRSINFDNEDFRFADQNILANTNSGTAQIYGGLMSLYLKPIRHLKTSGSITYTKGEHLTLNRPLSSIPPIFGSVDVSYHRKKYYLALNYRFALEKDVTDYNLIEGIDNIEETYNESGTPKWSVLNFNSKYHFNRHFWINFQIQNMFDVHYKPFASSLSAPGRNFVTAVYYNF